MSGKDGEVLEFELKKTRQKIRGSIALILILTLCTGVMYGVVVRDIEVVKTVATVLAPITGMALGFYFKEKE